ncbi:hypothetical protein RM704_23105 [Streptomyces sp. DSM 3412]|uniref:Uncharacterized protein n=1 Tax=Streptomyces gottesmaniae TaxID=3075518 RepID=A0ABU2Z161_9ACTN|nr:hypothetical protein [Streptomyces sp. DSM 3412]MDT0570322.1 hypothetical protein [Streptomyces sp. DSM 3412]
MHTGNVDGRRSDQQAHHQGEEEEYQAQFPVVAVVAWDYLASVVP